MIKEFAVISRKNKKKITKFASPGGDGAEIIYALRNNDTLSKKIATEIEKTGQNVRKYYQRRLPSNPAKDYYYILRDTPNNESIIVEYGFLDSNGDDVSQIKNNWEEMAEAVVKAIAEYIGVPYEPESMEGYYKVQSGDTLWGIARKFNITVDELKSANNLKDNSLSIGQLLYIPTNEEETEEGEIYIVQRGDTLYGIANKFNITVDELKKLNNLTSNNLSIGQKLIVSMPESKTTTYVVNKGDTLYGIANKFGVTVDNIKKLNNLSSNNLSIGQVLKIPTTTSDSKLTYTVKKGDSLYSIARTYNTTVDEIKRLNNLTSNNLSIGQTLLLPN